MSTFTQILYHIVFSTKDRESCFDANNRHNLFSDIWGIISKHHCHLYRINGVQDHIHILSSLHPTVALADFIKNIKLGSSSWIKESGAFPRFRYWQDGYGAFTASWNEKNALIESSRIRRNIIKSEPSRTSTAPSWRIPESSLKKSILLEEHKFDPFGVDSLHSIAPRVALALHPWLFTLFPFGEGCANEAESCKSVGASSAVVFQ